ncbi:hypothetical protein [Arthrobacter sp. D2-10]
MSTSRQKGGSSTSRQDSTDDILSVADLAALPRGRAVMLGSGARAVLLRTVPISDRPYAGKVAASEAAHSNPRPAAESAAEPAPAASGGGNRWSAMVGE